MEAVAMYDWDADEDNEVTFKRGHVIKEVIAFDGGWSKGRLVHNGEYGLFPSNYVKMRRAVGEFSLPLSLCVCVCV